MKPNTAVERWIAPIYLIACVVLGGASAAGYLANAILQLGGLGVIVFLVARGSLATLPPAARGLLRVVAAGAAYLLLTLIPLPASLWAHLPGRASVAHGFALLGGGGLPLSALSLDPGGTVRALLSFIVPSAMFFSILASPPKGRRDTVIALGIFTIISIILGVSQMASGFYSKYYIYHFTSFGGAVGFFANRNHLATLCLMTMPFMAALASSVGSAAPRATKLGRQMIAGGALLFLTLGAGVVQSLAGWLLLLPTLLGCFLVYQHGRGGGLTRRIAPMAGIVLAIAVLAGLFAPLSPVDLNRTMGEVQPHQRQTIMATTWTAAKEYLPLGSGLGSFVRVYPSYEPADSISRTYINHAHNDYLELVLEAGIPGLALLAAFLIWWFARARELWTVSGGGRPLGRAATVSLCVLYAHSFVDYPFRTAAIAGLAGLACGLMTLTEEAVPSARRKRSRKRGMIMLGDDEASANSSSDATTGSADRAKFDLSSRVDAK